LLLLRGSTISFLIGFSVRCTSNRVQERRVGLRLLLCS